MASAKQSLNIAITKIECNSSRALYPRAELGDVEENVGSIPQNCAANNRFVRSIRPSYPHTIRFLCCCNHLFWQFALVRRSTFLSIYSLCRIIRIGFIYSISFYWPVNVYSGSNQPVFICKIHINNR